MSASNCRASGPLPCCCHNLARLIAPLSSNDFAFSRRDFSGYFTYPKSEAFARYHELYCATVSRRGGDPNIGPRLPLLSKQCGFEDVGVCVVQPIGTEGEAKLINPITM